MKFFLKLYLLLILTAAQCQPQDYGKLTYETTLPSILQENSGISLGTNDSQIYVINDSGGSNQVFTVDVHSGKIIQDITVTNATNIDWEDLASSGDDLFIGDFGNNENNRTDQTIYWVEDIAHITDPTYTTYAKSTTFTLEDQKKYPPKKGNHNFDIEAFIVHNSHFYLFTRNRNHGKNFDGTTKLYRVPQKEGHHTAVLIDSFISCSDRDDCQITSATIDHTTGKVAVLSYNKVWIFDNYEDDNFFTGYIHKIKLKHYSQKESITFKDSNTLLISEEGTSKKNGNLYSLRIDN
ncbi:hypothetical protein [Dokdonia sp.]|uniref:hypothetical protein n=1 Tax=Dokdonia sp. TaxID=2024995 RepID=UPI0032672DD9